MKQMGGGRGLLHVRNRDVERDEGGERESGGETGMDSSIGHGRGGGISQNYQEVGRGAISRNVNSHRRRGESVRGKLSKLLRMNESNRNE